MRNENVITALQPTAAPVPAVSPVPPVASVLSVPCVPSPTTIGRKRNRPHPPNCTVCDLAPSRFLAFRAKQSAVEAEYGFRLGVPRRTDAERDGYRRYMRDWHRRYGEAHREARKAYRHAYWLNVTKRGFDSLAEATGDEAALNRKAEKKAAKQKRMDYEERKRQVHEQYGFWLNTPPRTPEEAAGRVRYRKDQDALRKERNREQIVAYQKAHNAKRREENERKFQDALNRMMATDPVAAEKFKARHETLCRIQHMTPAERVRYREQKEAERRTAQAARAVARKQAREEARRIREAQKAEERRQRKQNAANPPRPTKREVWLREMSERRKEREAEAAALMAKENELRANYAAEREANRKAYLAKKNASSHTPASASGGSQFTATADCVATENASCNHGNATSWLHREKSGGETSTPGRSELRPSRRRDGVIAPYPRVVGAAFHRRPQSCSEDATNGAASFRVFPCAAQAAFRVRCDDGTRRVAGEDSRRPTQSGQGESPIAPIAARRSIVTTASVVAHSASQPPPPHPPKDPPRIATGGESPEPPELPPDPPPNANNAANEAANALSPADQKRRAQEAAYRERNREHLTAYNREYRRRRRAEALAKAQTTWTPEQWATWRKREADKACPPGSPSWLVREVVKRLAAEQSLPEDAVMGRLTELGGLDFLIKGAESMGRTRCSRPSSVAAAIHALALYLDPDAAAMFGGGKG